MKRGEVEKPTMVIRDPAVAVAAGKCWMARWMGGTAARLAGAHIDSFHPEECSMCEYDLELLIDALEEFLTWSGISAEAEEMFDTPNLRPVLEGFFALSTQQQEQEVLRAQGYVE